MIGVGEYHMPLDLLSRMCYAAYDAMRQRCDDEYDNGNQANNDTFWTKDEDSADFAARCSESG